MKLYPGRFEQLTVWSLAAPLSTLRNTFRFLHRKAKLYAFGVPIESACKRGECVPDLLDDRCVLFSLHFLLPAPETVRYGTAFEVNFVSIFPSTIPLSHPSD
jgi:hypothetical protein